MDSLEISEIALQVVEPSNDRRIDRGRGKSGMLSPRACSHYTNNRYIVFGWVVNG